jgi:hypothetical protein
MRCHTLCAGLLAGIALSACDESPTPAEPGVGTPSLSQGAIVGRGDEFFLFGMVDQEHGYSAIVGAAPDEVDDICADPNFAAYDQKDLMVVMKPHTGEHKVTIRDHEEQYIIWQGLPTGRISCTFMNVPPLAVGTLHSIETNSIEVNGPAPGANVWHYRATGTLVNPVTGQEYHVTATLGGFAPPGGEMEFEPTFIAVKPIPR